MRATIWWQRECAVRNAIERRASLEKVDAQADPVTVSGKAEITGRMSEAVPPVAVHISTLPATMLRPMVMDIQSGS